MHRRGHVRDYVTVLIFVHWSLIICNFGDDGIFSMEKKHLMNSFKRSIELIGVPCSSAEIEFYGRSPSSYGF